MGRLRATKLKQNHHATELRQLQEELRRIFEKFESHESEFAEALEQYLHDLKPEVKNEVPESKTPQAIWGTCTLLATLRLPTESELVIKLT